MNKNERLAQLIINEKLRESVSPIRIACHTSRGYPLIVPLWYQLEEGYLWSVTHKNAKVLSHIRRNSKTGFEIANNDPPYHGIRGYGTIEIFPDLGKIWLPRLLKRYAIRPESKLAHLLLSRADDEVALRLSPIQMTAWDYSIRMQDAL
jgi:hypothetical protein